MLSFDVTWRSTVVNAIWFSKRISRYDSKQNLSKYTYNTKKTRKPTKPNGTNNFEYFFPYK